MSHSNTILLYIFLVLWAVIFGRLCQSRVVIQIEDGTKKVFYRFKFFPFVFAFVVPWYFLSFTNIGVDYDNYFQMVDKVTIQNYADYVTWEPFFNLMSVFFKSILFNNTDAVLFSYKTITTVLIASSIYIMRYDIKIWLSMLAYMMLFYFGSFYLLSMCLASSIVMFAVVLWFKKKKFFWALGLILLSAQIHNSIYLFLPVFLSAVYMQNSKSANTMKMVILAAGYFIATLIANYIFQWAIGNIASFHYDGYTDADNSGQGLMIYFRYGLLAAILMYYANQNKDISDYIRFMVVFAFASAMFYSLAYSFRVIGRMDFTLISLYVLFLPLLYLRTSKNRMNNVSQLPLFNFLMIAFLFYIGYEEMSGRIVDKISPGLGRWHFFMPF